jgi:hypothetical protein
MIRTLKYLTDEALLTIKHGDKELFCKIMDENPNNPDWIEGYIGKKAFTSSAYQFDFEMKNFDKMKNSLDYDNAIALYELFAKNKIGPAIIYNEKFLTGFIFTFAYEYFMNVSGAKEVSKVFATLFFENDVRRSVSRNTIGMLYRFVELTIEENEEDPYWLTKFVFNYPVLFRIKYYTSTDGENTHKAYFKAFKEWIEETKNRPTLKIVEKVRTHLSVLSNISDTDLMDEIELVKYLKDYLNKITKA